MAFGLFRSLKWLIYYLEPKDVTAQAKNVSDQLQNVAAEPDKWLLNCLEPEIVTAEPMTDFILDKTGMRTDLQPASGAIRFSYAVL